MTGATVLGRYLRGLLRPWKLVTFALGTAFFVWGAYFWDGPTWDVGVAILMSTHTLDVAEQVADRIGIIHHGRLVALGTLEELHEQARIGGRLEDVFLRLTEEGK